MKRQKTNTGLFRQVALIVCLFAGLFSGWSAAAQQSGVHGQVTDRKTGQPVVGATVRVEGTTIATSTDILGQYRIAALPDKCTLIFSYVGYESRTVEYHAQQTAVDVALAEDVQNLDEVVVVGYISNSKRETTTAISSLRDKDLTTANSANLLQSIQDSSRACRSARRTVRRVPRRISTSAASGPSMRAWHRCASSTTWWRRMA